MSMKSSSVGKGISGGKEGARSVPCWPNTEQLAATQSVSWKEAAFVSGW